MLARALIVAGALTALALGGCSLTPSSSASTSGFTGTKGKIASTLNALASDANSGDGSDICKSVVAPAVRGRLNKIGNCTTIINNQLKTIDDFTVTVKSISFAGTSATARVQTALNGKKVISSVALSKEPAGWRIASIGAL